MKLSQFFHVTLDELVFRDIEKEGLLTKVGEAAPVYEKEKDRFTKLLERRVDELEKVIRESDPEKAKELGIE